MKRTAVLAIAGLAAAGVSVLGPTAAEAAACSFRQLTEADGTAIESPQLSGDGTKVAFVSDGEFGDGADNQDGSPEVFLYDLATGPEDIRQLTNAGTSFIDSIAIDDDGDRVA